MVLPLLLLVSLRQLRDGVSQQVFVAPRRPRLVLPLPRSRFCSGVPSSRADGRQLPTMLGSCEARVCGVRVCGEISQSRRDGRGTGYILTREFLGISETAEKVPTVTAIVLGKVPGYSVRLSFATRCQNERGSKWRQQLIIHNLCVVRGLDVGKFMYTHTRSNVFQYHTNNIVAQKAVRSSVCNGSNFPYSSSQRRRGGAASTALTFSYFHNFRAVRPRPPSKHKS